MFFILSCGNESFDFLSLILLILFLGLSILILYGANKLCDDIIEKNYKKPGNLKFYIFVIIVIILLMMLIYLKKDNLADPCNNLVPMLSVGKALFRIFQIFVPITLIVRGIINIFKYFMYRKINKGSDYIRQILRSSIVYIIVALVVFFIFTGIDVLMLFVSDDNFNSSTSWPQCWCRD